MTSEEIGRINQLKSALRSTFYYIVNKSTSQEIVLILYRKDHNTSHRMFSRSNVTNFIRDAKKTANISAEELNKHPLIIRPFKEEKNDELKPNSSIPVPTANVGQQWWNRIDD